MHKVLWARVAHVFEICLPQYCHSVAVQKFCLTGADLSVTLTSAHWPKTDQFQRPFPWL